MPVDTMRSVKDLPLIECCTPISVAALSPDDAAELERLFKALADRHRLQILNCLLQAGEDSICVCDFEAILATFGKLAAARMSDDTDPPL